MSDLKCWVRRPGPGEFRGEGEWFLYIGAEARWLWLRDTQYLPTWVGPTPPTDEEFAAAEAPKP